MKTFSKNWKSIIPTLLIPILLIGVIIYSSTVRNKNDDLQYYQIVNYFQENKVESFELNINSGKLTYKLRGEERSKTYTVPNFELFIMDIGDSLAEYNKTHPDAPIKYNYINSGGASWILNLLPSIIMFILLGVLFYFMMSRMSKAVGDENNRTLSFGKAKTKSLIDSDKKKTTFDDVAGADEEKEELAEIVDFLKNPQKYDALGARVPKGVLLVGPPGTGKTLLARAVAGEANAPFLSISGSNFVEMYVGVGASRVRDLFEQAKKSSPSLIFIDEIDAVGRHRGAGMGGGHDEREQTLNQLLIEMDGFEGNSGVIVIAATNRPDILDPALLRPRRFDRQITVGYPNTKGREDILKVHARNKAIGPDVDLAEVAKATTGFTGAELENLLNEAALLAARRHLKAITKPEIDEATIKVVMGTEKASHRPSEKERKLTAYHEGGHAIATYCLESQDKVHQVSIIPRGRAGGYTMSLPKEDKSYMSMTSMLDQLVVLLGGRVAEALVLDDISTGASNDIQRATKIARDMVTKYGMSSLGPMSFGSDNDEVFIGRDYGHVRDYSEVTASKIDEEVEKIINDAYARTKALLEENIDKLHVVAQALLEREKIDGNQFEDLMTKGYIVEKEEKIIELPTEEKADEKVEDTVAENESDKNDIQESNTEEEQPNE